MTNHELDLLLEQELPELPPDNIVSDVTPWRKAVNRVLIGMGLTSLTLNFLYLNYLLPFIGIVMLLLGFRALRRENGWFRLCWLVSLVRLTLLIFRLTLYATIYHDKLSTPFSAALNGASVVLQLVLVFALWRGFRRVRQKAGFAPGTGSGLALLVWCALTVLLAQLNYTGFLLGLIFVVAYVCILRSLHKLSAELDEAGYAIRPAPVGITDGWVKGIATGLLVIGLALAYLFLNSYPMDWTPVSTTENAQVEQIKSELLSLGFPEGVLDDLTEEDILACEGAVQIYSITEESSYHGNRDEVNNYRVNTETDYYDFRFTQIAVMLPEARETWKIIQHFEWTVTPDFYGTESILLWPTSHIDGWCISGDFTGQLLYELDDVTYSAPFYRAERYIDDGLDCVDLSFSLPKNGERQRGYISYHASELTDGYIISSWFNYFHQTGWAKYPALSGAAARWQDRWSILKNYTLTQYALQFDPNTMS